MFCENIWMKISDSDISLFELYIFYNRLNFLSYNLHAFAFVDSIEGIMSIENRWRKPVSQSTSHQNEIWIEERK